MHRYEVMGPVTELQRSMGLNPMFRKAFLRMKSFVRAGLEIKQCAVGSLTLEVDGKTSNQGVQEEMGWLSFEGREGSSEVIRGPTERNGLGAMGTRSFQLLVHENCWQKMEEAN